MIKITKKVIAGLNENKEGCQVEGVVYRVLFECALLKVLTHQCLVKQEELPGYDVLSILMECIMLQHHRTLENTKN